MLKLEIPNTIFEQMLQQSKTEAPLEACGILAGKDGIARKLYKMTNADQSSVHFMMKPEEQFQVIKDTRAASLEMLAIYHSHPTSPARLSQEDIRLAVTPDVVYIIVSLISNEPATKGFIIENGVITEVLITIVEK